MEDCRLDPCEKKSVNTRLEYRKNGKIRFNTVIEIFLIIIIAFLVTSNVFSGYIHFFILSYKICQLLKAPTFSLNKFKLLCFVIKCVSHFATATIT